MYEEVRLGRMRESDARARRLERDSALLQLYDCGGRTETNLRDGER